MSTGDSLDGIRLTMYLRIIDRGRSCQYLWNEIFIKDQQETVLTVFCEWGTYQMLAGDSLDIIFLTEYLTNVDRRQF